MGSRSRGGQSIRPSLFLLVFSLMSWVAFSGPAPSGEGVTKSNNLNILLITLDTTRADRIGIYGYSQGKTPNLDSLARQGIMFLNAYCPTPLTLPSHCSILTGTYPLYHKVRNNGSYYLSAEAVTLAERLKEKGYRTAAFVSSFTVDSRFGLDQGFDSYDDRFSREEMFKTFRSERAAEDVADSFLSWLNESSKEKFFAWVHFYDPHMPYSPPSPYKEEFPETPYDGEIAYMDFHVGRIIDRLKELRLLDRTLVVAAGDHGEAFREKEELDHGIFLYDVTMKVPLIFFAEKNLPQHKVIPWRVRLIDVMPTILDLVRIPTNRDVQGQSLLPSIEGKQKEDLTCYLETYYPPETYGWSELLGIIEKNWKYIKAPRPELYNLKDDAKEENNLLGLERKQAAALQKKLDGLIKDYSSRSEVGRRRISREEEDRLRSLGYVGADASVRVPQGPLPDPKDRMGEFKIIYQAKLAEAQGNLEEAEKYYRETLRLSPDVSWHYVGLAILLVRMKRMEEAIEVLQDGLKRLPDSLVLLSRLASFYMRTGRFKEAFETSEIILNLDPGHFDALVIAGWSQDFWGKWAEAERYFKLALDVEPENKFVRMKYAYALGALGRGEEAARIYETLKKEFPEDYRICQDLGVVYTSLDKLALAEENLKKAVELAPFPETYLSYSAILERVGKLEEAIIYIKLYLENTKEGETPRKIQARKALADWEKRLRQRK